MGHLRDWYGNIYIEWDALARVQAANVSTKLNMLRRPIQLVEEGTHDPAVVLDDLEVLSRCISDYAIKLARLTDAIAQLEHDIAEAAAGWEAPEPPDNGILEDEELIDRLGDFYGIPKPKPRR